MKTNNVDVQTIAISVLILAVVASLVWSFVWLHGEEKRHEKVFTQWSEDCREAEGVVQASAPNQLQCYINGKLVCLEAYKNYKYSQCRE